MPKKKTTEEFIADARKVHGDKFKYDRVEYKGALEDVIIGCRVHGYFPQRATDHLSGAGCKQCALQDRADEKRLDQNSFLEKAIQVHGDRYKYEHVVYKNLITPVSITCKVHGDFPQKPANHIYLQQGCPDCYDEVRNQNKRLGTEEFIRRATEKFGDKFDYSKVSIETLQDEIEIGCPVHGPIMTTPFNHLNSITGCHQCGLDKKARDKIEKVAEEIKQKLYDRFGDIFDLTEITYTGYNCHVIVTCKSCGRPSEYNISSLLRSEGCLYCLGLRKDTEMFIEQAKEIHGDLYDYSKTVFVSNSQSVIVTCKKHGDFKVNAGAHIFSANGCSKCHYSHGELKIALWLNELGIKFEKEKTFPWLKYKAKMRLDFYLPEYNVAIECQGIQHFGIEFKGFNAVNDNMSLIRKRDITKYNLCKEHGVRILYFCFAGNHNSLTENYIDKVLHTKQELIDSILIK